MYFFSIYLKMFYTLTEIANDITEEWFISLVQI